MNKKQKKELKKKVLPLALCGMMVVGASAWLTNKEVQTGVNKIQTGTTEVVFKDKGGVDLPSDDENSRDKTTINISGATVIPMTNDWAYKNLKTYKFNIKNGGTVPVSYKIYLVSEGSEFAAGKVAYDFDSSDSHYGLVSAVAADEKQLIYTSEADLAANENKDFELLMYLPPDDVNADVNNLDADGNVIDGKEAQYHLEIVAEQANKKEEDKYQYTIKISGDWETEVVETSNNGVFNYKNTKDLPAQLNDINGGGPVILANQSSFVKNDVTYGKGIYAWDSATKTLYILADADGNNLSYDATIAASDETPKVSAQVTAKKVATFTD